jgi:acyl carrier protein
MTTPGPRNGTAHIHAGVDVRISWSHGDGVRPHATDGWDEQFESILRARLPCLPADEPLTADLGLRAYGLDSIGVVDLLVALENAYNVRLPKEATSMETFATAGVLWRTLSKFLS